MAQTLDNNQVTAMSSPNHGVGIATDKVKVLQGRPVRPGHPRLRR